MHQEVLRDFINKIVNYMFESFPEVCRSYGIQADVRSLLLLRKAMDKRLVNTIGDMYALFKGALVKDPTLSLIHISEPTRPY